MRKYIFAMLCLLTLCMSGLHASAQETGTQGIDLIEDKIEDLDLDELEGVIDKSSATSVPSLSELMLQAVRGEIDLSPDTVLDTVKNALVGEIASLGSVLGQLIIVGVLSAFFKALSSSFKTAEVAEVAFLVSYMATVSLLAGSFMLCVGIMEDMLTGISDIIVAAQPVILTLSALSGDGAAAAVISPVIIYAASFLTLVMSRLVAPMIVLAATLRLVSSLFDKEVLSKYADLIQKCVSWGLRAVAVIFMGILSLQRISAPILSNTISKTSKAALGAVPVVGDALSGAVDSVLYWAGSAKSGLMVALVIVLVLACLTPIIKLAASMLVYKLTAALLQPMCDKRIVEAIDAAGNYAALLIGVCLTSGAMFIFMTMGILSL